MFAVKQRQRVPRTQSDVKIISVSDSNGATTNDLGWFSRCELVFFDSLDFGLAETR